MITVYIFLQLPICTYNFELVYTRTFFELFDKFRKMSKRRSTRAKTYDLELPSTTTFTATNQDDQQKTVVQPSKFFGEPGEDIEKWLKSFERVSKANNWTEKRQCDILPAFLRDRAAEFYDELPPRSQDNLDRLKEDLTEHFMPKEARRFYYADLYSRKQGNTESADDFGRVIQQLVRRAYAEMPLEHQDTLMREHFVNGLRPDLKRIILITDPKTFNQAVDVAKREEINEQVTNGSAPWVRPQSAVAASPVAAVSGEQKMNERLDRLEGAIEKLALTLAETNVNKRSGNRNFGYGRKYNRYDDRNLRTSDGRPICNFCKKVGHYESACQEKKSAGQNAKN